MPVTVWKQMNWSWASKKTGRALFTLVARDNRWRVATIELFDEKGIPRGTAYTTSFPASLIREIERQALKMHGTPKGREDDLLDPLRRSKG